MKILAVDDEPLVLRLLEATLEGLGYSNADFVTSGTAALAQLNAAQTPYSCILLDIRMPGMDGIELCRAIRQMPKYQGTPILMLTALSEKTYVDESFASGATDYINKPIDATELGARLRVARIIHTERERAAQASIYGQGGNGAGPKDPQFDFEDPIQIRDVPRVVNALAFENYLQQLDRLGLFKTGIIGFQIRHADSLFAVKSRGEFSGILTDVAESIFENTRYAKPLVSYLGSGTFVAVVPRARLLDRSELETGIAMTLLDIQLAEVFGPEYDVHVEVGHQINGGMFRSSPKAMIEAAVASVRQHAPGLLSGGFASRIRNLAS